MLSENKAGYVDGREAARIIGITQRAVRKLAAQQRLEVKREDESAAARLMVSLASVERLRSERQQGRHTPDG